MESNRFVRGLSGSSSCGSELSHSETDSRPVYTRPTVDPVTRPTDTPAAQDLLGRTGASQDPEPYITELCHKNQCWQKYCSQLEGEIAHLKKEKDFLQRQLSETRKQAEREIKEVKEDNQRLRLEVESCRLEQNAVRQVLANSRNENSALKAQLVLNTEDFEAERRDRVRVQEKLNNTESELIIAKREIHQYSLERMQDLAQRRRAALDYHQAEYARTHPEYVPPAFSTYATDVVTDDGEEVAGGNDDQMGYDEIDSGVGMDQVYSIPERTRKESEEAGSADSRSRSAETRREGEGSRRGMGEAEEQRRKGVMGCGGLAGDDRVRGIGEDAVDGCMEVKREATKYSVPVSNCGEEDYDVTD